MRVVTSCDQHAGDPVRAHDAEPETPRSGAPVQRRRYDSPAWRGIAHQHAELLRALLSDRPGTRQVWADRLGISRQALDSLIETERLYETDVAMLPTEAFVAYLDAVRELHVGASVVSVTKLQAVTDAHRECAEAVGAALAGTARGSTVSREEQVREIREAVSALERLRAVVEAQP